MKTRKVGIVHTSFALVDVLNALAKRILPEAEVVNIVDDSLLDDARRTGIDEQLKKRMRGYFMSAADAGADVILNACSTVGETVDTARAEVPIKILKIDEPMAEQAVALGRKIAVMATVESTLGPTCRLLQAKADEQGREVELNEILCEGAFELLMSGKTEEFDARVTEEALKAGENHDVIVFAQASMARLVPELEKQLSVPLLASPEIAMRRLAEMLE